MTERMTESKEAADLSARMHALGRFGESADVVCDGCDAVCAVGAGRCHLLLNMQRRSTVSAWTEQAC